MTSGGVALDPLTKQNVWIYKFNDDEEEIAELLDHFQFNQLSWMFEPKEVLANLATVNPMGELQSQTK